MRWIKKNLSSIILVLIFIIGLSLLLYPSFSDYWNSFHQSRAIASYAQTVTTIDDDQYEKMWAQAQEYNTTLAKKQNRWVLSEEEYEEYESLLNIGGTGIIGYIEIPNIKVSLPIYHGVDEAVLQIAVGHIEGSSLPVGGEGTHCVISGHRGLPSAKLFTNLDEMEEGDLFMMRVLDETLTYEVDQIRIVEPEDLSALEIEEGKDLCTLVTCTPYGINSHRLLVRGHRVENMESANSIRVTADAMQIDPVMVAPVIAVPILLILLIWLLVHYRKRR
ncbi:MAG: class C sortase [Oliverpabstia sp.]